MKIQALIVDRDCGAIVAARERNVPVHIVSFGDDKASFGARLQGKVEEIKPDFIMLAGFLRKIPDEIVNAYHNRIFNTHPSLLPEFGGAGMYGSHVHQAVIASGKTYSGVSFHQVSSGYDQGEVIARKKIPVVAGDTAASLEEKVKRVEKFFVIEQLNAVAARWRREVGTVLL